MLAEVKGGKAEWTAPEEVVFRDAFDGCSADLRYRISPSRFEQDVIVREQIPPESLVAWGLNPLSTRLVILTEFFDAPEPSQARRQLPKADKGELADYDLSFGAMTIGAGSAFAVATEEAAETEPVPVGKAWELLEGRRFLTESVDYTALGPLLESLPPPGHARSGAADHRVKRTAALREQHGLPLPPKAARARQARVEAPAFRQGRLVLPGTTVRYARLTPAETRSAPGAVLDYALQIGSAQTNYTFKGDTTYYISAAVPLTGTTGFEAGTVIKFAPTNNARLIVKGPINWQGTAYRPIVLTARDDASSGDAVSGAGTLSGYYAAVALDLDTTTNTAPALLSYFRVAYAQKAVAVNGRAGHVFSHGQLVNCQNGFGSTYSDLSLRNVLFFNTLTNFNGSSSTGRCEHVTVNTASWCNYNGTCTQFYLTNSLLAGVTNAGNLTVTNATAVLTSAEGIFQGVGQGSNYLAPSSPYRNWANAATDINADLAKDLKNLTTYPPVVLSADFTADTVLSPQAQRDTDTLDLGYHYVPLDYCLSALNLTNATLLLTNGVAVGVYGQKGITLRTGAKFVSESSPTRLNRLVRYTAVQEQPAVWGTAGAVGLLDLNAASPPEVRLRFTEVALLADPQGRRDLVNGLGYAVLSTLALTDCQLRGACLDVWANASGMSISLTNNLLQRGYLSFYQENIPGYYGFTLDLYNNLWTKGTVSFNKRDTRTTWTVKDNLFDSDNLYNTGSYSPTACNNGYRAGLTSLGGSNNKTGLTMDFQTGPASNWFGVLGTYYYPTSGTNLASLIDTGSRSPANATLYHYTVKAATGTKEGTDAVQTVDIGFHYFGVDASGQPNDCDGDGLPDCLEDRNGNGNVDTGETDWQTSENGTTGVPGLQVFNPLAN
jgi:hypothetical protein